MPYLIFRTRFSCIIPSFVDHWTNWRSSVLRAGGDDFFFLSITGMIRFDNQFRPTRVWIYIRVAGGFYVRLILTRIVVSRQAWTVRAAETTIRFLFYHGARCCNAIVNAQPFQFPSSFFFSLPSFPRPFYPSLSFF